MSSSTYTNQQGISFDIEVHEGDAPAGADYYGYIFQVRANDRPDQLHFYKVIIMKLLCKEKRQARMWLNSTVLDFLHEILETYNEGRTTMLIPSSREWFIA